MKFTPREMYIAQRAYIIGVDSDTAKMGWEEDPVDDRGNTVENLIAGMAPKDDAQGSSRFANGESDGQASPPEWVFSIGGHVLARVDYAMWCPMAGAMGGNLICYANPPYIGCGKLYRDHFEALPKPTDGDGDEGSENA